MHIIPGLLCHLLCKPYNFHPSGEYVLIIQRDRNMGSLSAAIRVKDMSSTKKEENMVCRNCMEGNSHGKLMNPSY